MLSGSKVFCLFFTTMLGMLTVATAPAVLTGQDAPFGGHLKELVTVTLPARISGKLTVTSSAFKNGAHIP
jgi:hypothetical protein